MKNLFHKIKKLFFNKEQEKGTKTIVSKEHSLDRFVEIQELMFERALSEVKSGRKTTHWIWFIFPQLKGLGTSPKAQYFGIDNIEEATAYIQHSVLATNLRTIATALLELDGYDANDIFGELDSMKVRSSMTLFDIVSPNDVFAKVLDKYYNSSRCELTLKMLHATTYNQMRNNHQFITKLNVSATGKPYTICYRDSVESDTVICTANFEFGTLNNPIKIIAVSGGAVNALESFCKEGKNKHYDNVDFVAITHTYHDKLEFQENNLHKLVFDAEQMLRYRNMGDNTLLHFALDNVVGNDTRHVIFVHTFGSTLPNAYLQYLKEKGITITLLATKPFLFEGTTKRERVEKELMQSRKHIDHLVIIDAEDVRKVYQGMSFFNAFPLLDKVIGEKIESILNDNTETIRDKQPTRQFPQGVIILNCKNYKKYLPLDIVAIAYAWDNTQTAILTSDSQLYYIDLRTGFTLEDIDKIIPPQEEIENMELISTQPGIDLYISNRHRDIYNETICKICIDNDCNVTEHNLFVNLLLNILGCKY